MQNTLQHTVELVGNGLHSGKPATLRLVPAPVGSGVLFRRTDVTNGQDPVVEARFNFVSDTTLNTRISNKDGVSVGTIEHLMAAFAGCGVHNVIVEIDGPEVPIFDGSSHVFAQAILNAGVQPQAAPLKALQILEEVCVEQGDAAARLVPEDGFYIDATIDFEDAAIGRQSCILDMSNGAFLRELSDCRTFCRSADVDTMRAQGLALGGNYLNAVVVEGERVLSPGGLRRDDEPVRHKMLDVLGDLYLAGMPIIGRYIGTRPGHTMSNLLLRELFSRPNSFRIATMNAATERRLPGIDVDQSDLAAVG